MKTKETQNRGWQQPWEKRHRTIRVVCVNCVKISYITLYGLANEYKDMVGKETCKHCWTVGKLSTSDLVKTRVKLDTTNQLELNWMVRQPFLRVKK